ncbi:MAG: polymer-forming cytoskeletal protein [Gammaproteobacteria bacterium]
MGIPGKKEVAFPGSGYVPSAPEEWALERIRRGAKADMAFAPGGGGAGALRKPADQTIEEWAKWRVARTLSAEFLKLVATRLRPTDISGGTTRIHIECAVIDGRLDLANDEVEVELWIQNSFLNGGIGIGDAHFHRTLSLDGSVAGGVINGGGMVVDRNFSLAEGKYTAVYLHGARIAGTLVATGSTFEGEVRLHGAKIGGRLDSTGATFKGGFTADGIEVNGGVFLRDGATFEGEVRLPGAKIGGQLSATGSTFREKFTADGIEVNGNVFLRGGATFEGEVRLLGAKIDGQLAATGSTFREKFSAERIEVNGNVLLRDGATFEGEVRLHGAKIGGQLDSTGVTFKGGFTADGIEVNGNVFLRGGATFEGEVRLLGAKIGGQFSATGSTFREKFSADGIEVNGPGFLCDGATFEGEVHLIGAKIHEQLTVIGATFANVFVLEHAWVGGAFFLRASGRSKNPMWGPGSSLNLTNAHVGSLVAQMPASWPQSGAKQKSAVHLVGFTYDNLDVGGAASHELEPEGLIEWIEKATPAGNYAPQPYAQLAKVFREMGAEDQAREVEIARFKHYYETRKKNWKKCWGRTHYRLDRYGVKPWYALLPLVALVAFGWAGSFSAFFQPDQTNIALLVLECLQFSIANMLPFSMEVPGLPFSMEKAGLDAEMVTRFGAFWAGAIRFGFFLQKICGFFLLGLFVRDVALS